MIIQNVGSAGQTALPLPCRLTLIRRSRWCSRSPGNQGRGVRDDCIVRFAVGIGMKNHRVAARMFKALADETSIFK